MSALEVKRLAHPGEGGNALFAVGGVAGLMLQITPSGGRSWLLRTVVGTRRREIGLGAFPEVSLAQAWDRAREARAKSVKASIRSRKERRPRPRSLPPSIGGSPLPRQLIAI
nr:Arm DNA-binding domain-containing protein [Haematobacter missouriensis]